MTEHTTNGNSKVTPKRGVGSHVAYHDGKVSQSQVKRSPLSQHNYLHKSLCSRIVFASLSSSEARPQSSVPQPCHLLDATELAVFGHYLTYTCRTIPFDEDELYVLQVGIPNLALRSKPVMSSLLALAATSRAFDLVHNCSTALQDLDEVRELLNFADQHYQISLSDIQRAVSCLNHFDHILANSALMVLYGLASHCVRIRITQMYMWRNEQVPADVLPNGTQWIFLIRAAHSAYIGLHHDSHHDTAVGAAKSIDSAISLPSIGSLNVRTLHGSYSFFPEDGPSKLTRRSFYPVLAATQALAFKKLRARFQAVASAETSRVSSDPQLRTCLHALETLSDIAVTIFFDESRKAKYSKQANSDPELGLVGPLSKVSSWLRTYIARVTSVEQSKPLRRTIMVFLNLVSMDYLRVVQSMLDRIPDVQHQQSSDLSANDYLLSCPKNQLALEIFAHWLVLVMLLDGVWWIGNTGEWELRRILLSMKHERWLAGAHQSWWPETMFNIRQDLFHGAEMRS